MKPKILLIDDEPDILHVVSFLLRTEGFDVETASSAEQALQMLSQTTYDLAVSDYLMPSMDGIQLLQKVRGKKDYTPFIFFSGNADNTHELKMTGLGAYQMLPKSQVKNLAVVISSTLKSDAEFKQIISNKTEEQDEFLELLHSA
jgi:two-component system response regulator HydG